MSISLYFWKEQREHDAVLTTKNSWRFRQAFRAINATLQQ